MKFKLQWKWVVFQILWAIGLYLWVRNEFHPIGIYIMTGVFFLVILYRLFLENRSGKSRSSEDLKA